jgi:response regulator RpfG family c-di-GMP phosphodiesterase
MKSYCNTVLLIDDNEIDNVINHQLMRLSSFAENIVTKQFADDALEYLRNEYKISKFVPDIIFLDILMPITDGFEFLESFETLHENLKTKTRIYMLSSSINNEDEIRASENKYVKQFLRKPLTVEVLEGLKKL